MLRAWTGWNPSRRPAGRERDSRAAASNRGRVRALPDGTRDKLMRARTAGYQSCRCRRGVGMRLSRSDAPGRAAVPICGRQEDGGKLVRDRTRSGDTMTRNSSGGEKGAQRRSAMLLGRVLRNRRGGHAVSNGRKASTDDDEQLTAMGRMPRRFRDCPSPLLRWSYNVQRPGSDASRAGPRARIEGRTRKPQLALGQW